MAKAKTVFICSNCGAEFSQWFGKCSNCDTFDSLVEQNPSPYTVDIPGRGGVGVCGVWRHRVNLRIILLNGVFIF